jgi:hypothetical protein
VNPDASDALRLGRGTATAIIALLVAAGAILRVLPGWSDFWLDEVWTWISVRKLESAVEIFTSIHHSNNNHLNSLLIYWLGDQSHWIVYRFPSLVAGVTTISLAAAVAGRQGRHEAIIAAILVSFSFALIHFSSEARGYSIAVCMTLAATLALDRALVGRNLGAALAFGLFVITGFLAHLVYLFFYAGAVALSIFRLRKQGDSLGTRSATFLRVHALPILGFALLWFVDLRHMSVGGGNPTDFEWIVSRTFGFGLGLPVVRALSWPYLLIGTSFAAFALYRLWRRGDDAWLLYGVSLVVAPAAVMSLFRPSVVAVRYFLIGLVFFLLLASGELARGWRRGGAVRVLCGVLIAGFLIGNGVHTSRFLSLGRGGYAAALQYMADHTDGAEIRVSSDNDFRNGIVLRFYEPWLPEGKRLVYLRRENRRTDADWRITHAPSRPAIPAPVVRDRRGQRFSLAAEFDHAAISGFYWAVYRRADADQARSKSH